MSYDKQKSRFNILSLDVKRIKSFINSGNNIELAVSEDGVDIGNFDPSVISWVHAIPNNIHLSRNKIGKSLLKQHRNGFLLNDPHMYQSRFCVEYHRMQDPALKRYFNSAPVRKRLESLGVVTKQDNVLCSKKEFAEYLRYLESLRALEVAHRMRYMQQNRLSDNLHKLTETKKYDSQFTGIFRHNKYKSERKSKANLTEYHNAKSEKQINSNLAEATERAKKIKTEKRNDFRQKSLEKETKFNKNKKIHIQEQYKKKIEVEKGIMNKLQEAEKRRKQLQNEKLTAKLTNEVESFKKKWMLRGEARKRNIKLYQFYEEEKRRNIKERENKLKQIREKDEIKNIKFKREIDRQKLLKKIIEKVSKKVKELSKKYLKSVDPKDVKEISRRFSKLTEDYIADYMDKIDCVMQILKIPCSAAQYLERLLSLLSRLVIIRPEIGLSQCVLVRERIAGLISNTITQIKNERLKHIKDHWIQRKKIVKKDISTDKNKKKKHTSIANSAIVIDIPSTSYDEFIGGVKNVSEQKSEKSYDLDKLINIGVKGFFETISKPKAPYSDKLNDRDFVHLYDFQKVFIQWFIRRIMEFVKIKQYHYWNVDRNISSWKKLNLNLDDLSYTAADLIIYYPFTNEHFCDVIQNISKYICVELNQELDLSVNLPKDKNSSDSEYEELRYIDY